MKWIFFFPSGETNFCNDFFLWRWIKLIAAYRIFLFVCEMEEVKWKEPPSRFNIFIFSSRSYHWIKKGRIHALYAISALCFIIWKIFHESDIIYIGTSNREIWNVWPIIRFWLVGFENFVQSLEHSITYFVSRLEESITPISSFCSKTILQIKWS